ncbi:MAG TPA: DUF1697 domain-containing protein [Kofleriaceae bacterium]
MARTSARETYLALLRGINVGGNNIIPMARLVESFTGLGHVNVKTLIASGNVVFQATKTDLRKLEQTIEQRLTADFAYDAKVVVKSHAEMAAIIDGLPKGWQRPSAAHRYYVIFLRHGVDRPGLVDELEPKAGVEVLTYRPGVLFWQAKISALTRSNVARLTQRKIYADVTIRNLNTTKKLAALMAAIASTGA